MKTLILVRHAKSSWDDLNCRDHDRVLNERGLRAAPLIGQALREKGYAPDLMVSSTASRAAHTAELIAQELDFPSENLHLDPKLYHSSIVSTSDLIRELADQINTVVLFGHNPTWTHLINQLAPFHLHNLPTCGAAIIHFDIDHWKQVRPQLGKAVEILLPSQYDPQHKSCAA